MNITKVITSILLIMNFQAWSKDALESKFQIDNNAVVPQIGYVEFNLLGPYACIDTTKIKWKKDSLPNLCKCIGFVQVCITDLFSESSQNSQKVGKLIKTFKWEVYENFYTLGNQFTNEEIYNCMKDVSEKEKLSKCKEIIPFTEDIPLVTLTIGPHWQCNGCHSYVDKKDGWVKLPKEPFKQGVWLDYQHSFYSQWVKPLKGDIIVADGAEAIDVKTNLKITLNAHKEWGIICVRLLKVEGEYAYVTRSIVSYQGGWCSDITRNIYKPGECTADKKVCDKSKAICSTLMKDYEILKIPTSAFLGKNGHVLGWCRDPENMDM